MIELASGQLLTSVKDGVRILKYNRPTKYNAICPEMYTEITRIFNEDALNDEVVVTILTGVGTYYSSGNDLSAAGAFKEDEDYDITNVIDEATSIVREFFKAFINYPKLLIAVVNGPAIGAAFTQLALCDIVYASDRATFRTPFVHVGLCPEGCSSYLFPRILGRSKASELILLGRTITAPELHQRGFISEVIPHEELDKLFAKLQDYGKLSVVSVKKGKELINLGFKNTLLQINDQECEMLKTCLFSPEFFEGVAKFTSRKSKL